MGLNKVLRSWIPGAILFGQEGCEPLCAATLQELDQAIQGTQEIALSLIDLSGFDQRIWERCEKLHQAKIPFPIIDILQQTPPPGTAAEQ